MRFDRGLTAVVLTIALAAGCQRSSRVASPGDAIPGAVEYAGTVVAVEYGHPYDGDFVMTVRTGPSATRVAYVEARMQISPDQLPFETDTPLGEIAVGDRVRVRGVPRGERLRIVQLRRLAP